MNTYRNIRNEYINCHIKRYRRPNYKFRLLHRIISCNKFFSNIWIRQDDLCPNCQEQDTLQHFFFQCSAVHDFWSKLSRWLHRNADFHLPLSLKEVLFGRPIAVPAVKVSNFIFLLSKFFIYWQRLFHGTDLNLVHFLMELRSKLKMEKFICELEGKPTKFNRWNTILTALG